MSGREIELIERAVDTFAAALFAAATAFAVGNVLRGSVVHPQLGMAVATALVLSYLLCIRTLRALGAPGPSLTLPEFKLAAVEAVALDELVLTDADRLYPRSDEPLVLDDVLAKTSPGSRVVRLFDPSAVPTPGQLKTRIDRHLGVDAARVAPPDASQALFEALAELRRSLA